MRGSPIAVLLLVCATLFAQSPYPLPTPPTAQSCPVNFYAKRTGGLIVQYANGSQKPISQGLNLTFTKHNTGIAQVIVTVHGMPAKGGIMLVHRNSPASNSPASDIVETFTLESHHEAGIENSEIWPHDMGPVRWVELMEIEFADGSIWQKSKDSRCVTEPSPFLLVAATAAAH